MLAQNPAPLGVGLVYNPSLFEYVCDRIEEYDFLEVTPDMFWTRSEQGFRPIPTWMEVLEWVRRRRHLVAHYIGLSIGTDGELDPAYLGQMLLWQKEFQFLWCSDHLSYTHVIDNSRTRHAVGLAAPVPYDIDICDQVSRKGRQVYQGLGVPFLLENSPTYAPIPGEDLTEVEFLNRFVACSGCQILLDLHNLYVNARNNGVDCFAFIASLTPGSVGELHIAGGSEIDGVYTDSHAGPCPDEVWQLLDYALTRQVGVRGITFEFHDSYFSLMGADGVTEQLRRARGIWQRHGAC
jgi:uncharacterized protein (UPF0276 family)